MINIVRCKDDLACPIIFLNYYIFIFLCNTAEGKFTFYFFFKDGFNNFMRLPFFSLRGYFVLGESEIEKFFSY